MVIDIGGQGLLQTRGNMTEDIADPPQDDTIHLQVDLSFCIQVRSDLVAGHPNVKQIPDATGLREDIAYRELLPENVPDEPTLDRLRDIECQDLQSETAEIVGDTIHARLQDIEFQDLQNEIEATAGGIHPQGPIVCHALLHLGDAPEKEKNDTVHRRVPGGRGLPDGRIGLLGHPEGKRILEEKETPGDFLPGGPAHAILDHRHTMLVVRVHHPSSVKVLQGVRVLQLSCVVPADALLKL